MKLKPIRNIIFVKPNGFYHSPNGLIIPELGTASVAPTEGVVYACGSKCSQIKEGDTVLFEQGTGLRFEENGEHFLILDEEHCQVILE